MTQDQKLKYKKRALDYWLKSSQQDWEAAQDLLKSKKYHHALFFVHLSLEKLLKAKITEKLEIAPPATHNLNQLVNKITQSTSEQIDQFNEITKFNLEARYDDYKLAFYKKATPEYTLKWFEIATKLTIWIKK